MSTSYHSLVIVGAGVSGLYAAQLLRSQFPDLLVVEAQDRVGGRIKQVNGMVPWAIEAGPEFVHGRHCSLVTLLQRIGARFEEKPWPDWWYFGKERKMMQDDQVGEEIQRLHDLMQEQVGEEEHPPAGRDVSAHDWLKSKGATPLMMSVADACYANDFAASLHELGLREMIEENSRWNSGETYLVTDCSMGEVIRVLSRGIRIQTNCPITRVDYDPQPSEVASSSGRGQPPVTLHTADGRKLVCKAVLITASLNILKAGVISFNPPLPQEKALAIQRVRMGNAVKVILTFSHRFWPEEQYDVVCPDCFVPEFWMLRKAIVDQTPGLPHHSIVGFMAGAAAAGIAGMPEEQVVSRFLSQLDEMYGRQSGSKPASSSLVAAKVVDWSKEQWVRGAYTFPSLGAELGDREALAAPVGRTLFFAGEACNVDMNPCVQGAMDSAQRAAVDIALSVKPAGLAAKL